MSRAGIIFIFYAPPPILFNAPVRIPIYVFTADGAGILDVCEKEPVDAAECLDPTNREDITACAQVFQSKVYCLIIHIG